MNIPQSPPGTADNNPRNQMKRKLNKQYIQQKINNVVEPMTISYFSQGGYQKDDVSVHFSFATLLRSRFFILTLLRIIDDRFHAEIHWYGVRQAPITQRGWALGARILAQGSTSSPSGSLGRDRHVAWNIDWWVGEKRCRFIWWFVWRGIGRRWNFATNGRTAQEGWSKNLGLCRSIRIIQQASWFLGIGIPKVWRVDRSH